MGNQKVKSALRMRICPLRDNSRHEVTGIKIKLIDFEEKKYSLSPGININNFAVEKRLSQLFRPDLIGCGNVSPGKLQSPEKINFYS